MSNTIATKSLSATLVPIPQSFPWTLRNYKDDPYLGVCSVELHRDGKMVILAKNDGRGGASELEIWTRGDESIFVREQAAIQEVLAGFHEAALKYEMDGTPFGGSKQFLDYDEERLADLLLAEGAQRKNLGRGRNVLIAKNRQNLKDGKFHTLRKSSHLSDDEALDAIRRHFPTGGAFLWSRGRGEWIPA